MSYLGFLSDKNKFCICKVAESRLAVRNQRPANEVCRDPPFQKLVSEVTEIKQSVKMLDNKVY